jgi:RNA polymerase sigma factor (TIGR02999 family)
MSPDAPVSRLLKRAREGDSSAMDELLPLVYAELHRLAHLALLRERPGHTLQPTALMNEAFLRVFGGGTPSFDDRAHFFGTFARAMRQILVDHARARSAQKRMQFQVDLSDALASTPATSQSLLDLDEAMGELGLEDERLVALIEMRFFAGMTAEETALARAESVHVIRHDLRYAKARLRRIMTRRNLS